MTEGRFERRTYCLNFKYFDYFSKDVFDYILNLSKKNVYPELRIKHP